MRNFADHVALEAVVLRGLAREADQDVVQIVYAVIGAPLHQFEIAHSGRMLLHQF